MSTTNESESVTLLAVGVDRGAAMIGVTGRHLRKEIKAGRLRVSRSGSRVLITVDALHDYLKAQAEVKPAEVKSEKKPARRRGAR